MCLDYVVPLTRPKLRDGGLAGTEYIDNRKCDHKHELALSSSLDEALNDLFPSSK